MNQQSAINKIIAHEKECAIRYENIEKQLNSGSKRFIRLEQMIWGLYGLLIIISVGNNIF